MLHRVFFIREVNIYECNLVQTFKLLTTQRLVVYLLILRMQLFRLDIVLTRQLQMPVSSCHCITVKFVGT